MEMSTTRRTSIQSKVTRHHSGGGMPLTEKLNITNVRSEERRETGLPDGKRRSLPFLRLRQGGGRGGHNFEA